MKVFILEAVSNDDESPLFFVGNILAFVGSSIDECKKFMAANQDFVSHEMNVVEGSDLENPELWAWRITPMIVNSHEDSLDSMLEFLPNGEELHRE